MNTESSQFNSISDIISSESLFDQSTVTTILGTFDFLSPYTRGRTYRVTSWAKYVGIELGMDKLSLKELEISALFCDIGMWAIPNEIINKRGRLSLAEFKIVQQHPELSLKALSSLPLSDNIRKNILHHHEKWDGGGYPNHLNANEIPLGAQIVNVSCTLFALTAERPHRVPVTLTHAVEIIDHESTKQFAPDVVKAVMSLHSKEILAQVLENEVNDPFERVKKELENSEVFHRINYKLTGEDDDSEYNPASHSEEMLSTIRKKIIDNL